MEENELKGCIKFETIQDDEKPWTHEFECGYLEDLAKITDSAVNGFGCHALQAFEYYYNKFHYAAVITEYEYCYNSDEPVVYVNHLGAYTNIHCLAQRCRSWIYRKLNTEDKLIKAIADIEFIKQHFITYFHDDGFSIKLQYTDTKDNCSKITKYELRITTVSMNQEIDNDAFETKVISFSNDTKHFYT